MPPYAGYDKLSTRNRSTPTDKDNNTQSVHEDKTPPAENTALYKTVSFRSIPANKNENMQLVHVGKTSPAEDTAVDKTYHLECIQDTQTDKGSVYILHNTNEITDSIIYAYLPFVL